jgi:hypothetical protein
VRVGDLDALFFERERAQIATASAAIVRALAARLSVACGCLIRLGFVVSDAQRARQRIELAYLLRVLQLELLGVVGAFGFGDEQPALEQLQFLAQSLV